MERNKRLNIESREAVKMDYAHLRPTANIPEQDFDKLLKMNPELSAPDQEIRDKAWKKFLAREGCSYIINPPRLDRYFGEIVKGKRNA
jgi:hypothetical protein